MAVREMQKMQIGDLYTADMLAEMILKHLVTIVAGRTYEQFVRVMADAPRGYASGGIIEPREPHPVSVPNSIELSYRTEPDTAGAALFRRRRAALLNDRCTEIADQVVPQYRKPKLAGGYYACGSPTAKRWQAAWDGACIALGGDPAEYRR